MTETAAPKSQLTELAKGTWRGPLGFITLKDDGSVDLDVGNCPHTIVSPGAVKLRSPEGCNREKHAGKLVLKPYELGVEKEDGSSAHLGGYLDRAGKLHVAILGNDANPQPINADRKGTINLRTFERLTLGDGCQLEDTFKKTKTSAACRWQEEAGRTVLIYEYPDPFDATKMSEVGLVLLAEEGLLVPPLLLEMVFEKS